MTAEAATPVRQMDIEAARRRRARMAEEQRLNKMTRVLVTPEGAQLHLKLATAAERAGAFAMDVAIQWAIVIATLLGLGFAASSMGFENANIAFAFWLVFYFFVRNFYYIFFEIGRKAATPGKRALGLRVASRDGGRLTANAVLARNFTREVEVGLPIQFLLMGGDQLGAWMALFGLLWSGVFLFFPVFNKDKMRVGDLIAGTWVIKAPKVKLMGDIAQKSSSPPRAATCSLSRRNRQTPMASMNFTCWKMCCATPLATSNSRSPNGSAPRSAGTAQPGETDIAFLEAYYAALRRRLEQRMLMGDRKADKFDVRR
jgi:uncharacterized RDD family membrane protein YckC